MRIIRGQIDHEFAPRNVCFIFDSKSTQNYTSFNANYQPQIDASGAQAPVISATGLDNGSTVNVNVTDNGAVMGALQLAHDTVSGGFDLLNNAGAAIVHSSDNAISFADTALNTSLKFAAGVAQGYADETRSQFDQVLSYTHDAYAGITGTLADSLHSATNVIATQNHDALAFFGQETAQLQNATVGAIDTVAKRTASENAQGLSELQSTLIKVAGIIVAGVIGYAVIQRARA